MMMLKPPFQADTLKALSYQIIYRPFPKILEFYTYELRCLVTLMLEKDPTKRPTIQEVQQYIQASQTTKPRLQDTFRVSVLQHTKVEPEDTKPIRTHTSMANSTVPAMNIEESLIVDQQFKQCEPDDVNLFLSLNKAASTQ
jgi:serine/threonine protein kinase